jgi:rod shape determining protein RodA
MAMLALMAVGIFAIRVSEDAGSAPSGYAARQLGFAGAGLVAFLIATFIPYSRVGRWAYAIGGATVCLLVLVFFLAPIRNSHRWIDLKFFLVQPSEIAKVSYVVLLAWYLRSTDHYRRLAGLLVPFLLTLVPAALILKEPDLGTSLLFLPTLFLMLFMAGAKLRHLLGIMAMAAALIFLPVPKHVNPADTSEEQADRQALAYWRGGQTIWLAFPLAHMEHHQLERVDGWLRQGEAKVRTGKGYQLHQSITVMGAGGLAGRSGWNDADAFFRMLPDDHTDFIFSVVGGQWGFVGCAGALALYAILFVFGVEIAWETTDAFGRLLAVGVLAMLFTQLVVNAGMAMGLMPITGMTLPFISYGGSSLVVNCAAVGLLVNVGQRRPISFARRPFEFGRRQDKPPAPFGPLAGE